MWGYNPGITATFGILQGISAIFSGINEARQVRRQGGTKEDAAFSGIGTSLFGLANAGMGVAINQGTGTYWGSAMSGFNALATNNFSFRGGMFGMPMMFGGCWPSFNCGCGFGYTNPYMASGFYPGPGFYC